MLESDKSYTTVESQARFNWTYIVHSIAFTSYYITPYIGDIQRETGVIWNWDKVGTTRQLTGSGGWSSSTPFPVFHSALERRVPAGANVGLKSVIEWCSSTGNVNIHFCSHFACVIFFCVPVYRVEFLKSVVDWMSLSCSASVTASWLKRLAWLSCALALRLSDLPLCLCLTEGRREEFTNRTFEIDSRRPWWQLLWQDKKN